VIPAAPLQLIKLGYFLAFAIALNIA
jgi:hypothetical protein